MKIKRIIILYALLMLAVTMFNIGAQTLTDSTSTSISVPGGIVCSQDGMSWEDHTVFPFTKTPTTGSSANCFLEEGLNNQGLSQDTCCPTDPKMECDVNVDQGTCKLSQRLFCWQYNATESDCNAADSDVGLRTAQYIGESCDPVAWTTPSGNSCVNRTTCTCKWQSGNCSLDQKSSVIQCTKTPAPSDTKECIYTLIKWEDLCDAPQGIINIEWEKKNPNNENDPECSGTVPKTLPCESVVRLSFFNVFNVVAVVIILIIIYYFISKIGRKKRK